MKPYIKQHEEHISIYAGLFGDFVSSAREPGGPGTMLVFIFIIQSCIFLSCYARFFHPAKACVCLSA